MNAASNRKRKPPRSDMVKRERLGGFTLCRRRVGVGSLRTFRFFKARLANPKPRHGTQGERRANPGQQTVRGESTPSSAPTLPVIEMPSLLLCHILKPNYRHGIAPSPQL